MVDLWLVPFLGAVGLVMGVLTAFVGFRPSREPFVWGGWYVVWLAVVYALRPAGAFFVILASSIVSGVFVAAVQLQFRDAYARNNPWYAEHLKEAEGRETWVFLRQGVVAGTLFGIGVGAVAWLIVRFAP